MSKLLNLLLLAGAVLLFLSFMQSKKTNPGNNKPINQPPSNNVPQAPESDHAESEEHHPEVQEEEHEEEEHEEEDEEEEEDAEIVIVSEEEDVWLPNMHNSKLANVQQNAVGEGQEASSSSFTLQSVEYQGEKYVRVYHVETESYLTVENDKVVFRPEGDNQLWTLAPATVSSFYPQVEGSFTLSMNSKYLAVKNEDVEENEECDLIVSEDIPEEWRVWNKDQVEEVITGMSCC